MTVDGVDPLGDGGRNHVPAEFLRVLGIEVVLTIFAGTAAGLDHVLVTVADDDREIQVLLHPALSDGLDGLPPPLPVGFYDALDDRTGEFPGGLKRRLPLLDSAHTLIVAPGHAKYVRSDRFS